jgi:ParB family chromosome partitioning protein
MTHKTVPLASLLPPKGNPRRTYNATLIEGLAESIKTDGLLHNLLVEPAEDGKYRVITGKRRFLALKLLKKRHAIDGEYKVPVDIRKDLAEADALRIATVENVQREPLNPVDEADAFAGMLQNGATIEDVAAKSGISDNVVRRRLALASLCKEAKEMVRTGDLPLGIAEALTLANEDQQRAILTDFKSGAELDRDAIRDMLLGEKPSAAVALFPLERYTGTFTRDLFADEESTFFDDVEQFSTLQKEAVAELAEKYRKRFAWVDILNVYTVPWWQYREPEKKDEKGVVINLSPTGRVEVREKLARHEVKEEVVQETRETPIVPKERPAYGPSLLRYVANHKSIAVQAALMGNLRNAKEVAAVLLLMSQVGGPVRITPHACLAYFGEAETKPKGYVEIEGQARRLAQALDFLPKGKKSNGAVVDLTLGRMGDWLAIYAAVQQLAGEELDTLLVYLLVLAYGQEHLEELDNGESLFNRVAQDLGVAMRQWWAPDEAFLTGLKRDQLADVAVASGASLRFGTLKDMSKKELVEGLARYFERTADPGATLDEHDAKGREWLPEVMKFPAEAPLERKSGE